MPRKTTFLWPCYWLMALAAVALLSTAPLHPAAAAKAKAAPSFFNSKETKSKNLKPFKKWTAAIKRFDKEDKIKDGKCDAKKMNKCNYARWMKLAYPVYTHTH